MKLGARIFKTGLAVVLALMLAELLRLPTPMFAGISAVFAIQPSIYRSYLKILEQVQGNLMGAIIAIVFTLLFGNHFLIIGLAAVILIMINLRLKIDTISLSVVTLIIIMETPQDEFITFAVLRFLTIMLGIFSAFIINLIFLPPKYETKLYQSISEITGEILKWIRITNHQGTDTTLLKKDMEALKERLIRLDQIYLLYKEERTFLKKKKWSKMRKLVVYRQMITTAKKALDILKIMNHYDHDFLRLPENTANNIITVLDELITNHEHLLIRYIGKAIQHHEKEMKEYENKRTKLLKQFEDYQKQAADDAETAHIFLLIAEIIDYNEQLEKLEILINSLEEYHSEEIPEKLLEGKI